MTSSTAFSGVLGDDVDRRRLQLDDIDVRVDAVQLARKPARSARLCDAKTTFSRWSSARRARREHGRPPAVERLDRPQAQVEQERPASERPGRVRRPPRLMVRHEVADQRAVRVQARVEVVRDQDAGAGGDRRDRGAAAVEDDQVGLQRRARPGRPRGPSR